MVARYDVIISDMRFVPDTYFPLPVVTQWRYGSA